MLDIGLWLDLGGWRLGPGAGRPIGLYLILGFHWEEIVHISEELCQQLVGQHDLLF